MPTGMVFGIWWAAGQTRCRGGSPSPSGRASRAVMRSFRLNSQPKREVTVFATDLVGDLTEVHAVQACNRCRAGGSDCASTVRIPEQPTIMPVRQYRWARTRCHALSPMCAACSLIASPRLYLL